jgi:hypothetical protein
VFRKELIVVVRGKDGKVEERRVVVDKNVGGGSGGDLVTLWGFRLISCLFADVVRWGSYSISFTELDGTSRSFVCISSDGFSFLGSGCGDRRVFIGFGSSSDLPVRTDYALRSHLATVRASYTVDESLFTITISGSWTPVSSVTVCEVGLFMDVCDIGGSSRRVLFDRSVLSPCVSVPAGSTVTATYVFRF